MAEPAARCIRLLTFNAGILSLRILGRPVIEPAPHVGERIRALPGLLASLRPDIIALQEVYALAHKWFLARELATSYPYAFFSERTKRIGLPSSLMLLSRWPLEETAVHAFTSAAPDEFLFDSKGFLSARIDVEGGLTFHLLNAHTTAGGIFFHPESRFTDRVRERQILQLLEAASSTGRPTVIAGDLNAGPGVSDANYKLVTSRGYVDAWDFAGLRATGGRNVTWEPENSLNSTGPHKSSPPQRIDHVFVPASFSSVISVASAEIVFDMPCVATGNDHLVTPSDHYGLMADLQLHGSPLPDS
jgi:endonuclease/exonuclease/phosphatase family metal-dependent hydrolase